ncbi:GNAT family N-acetyltransferase [uncultured Litoreibacter sp.]|uniref:GNAT family N-acetyltransferase n=1 Tax=uncultured Litoreibacter sp. TaxID=1392394 RepID=UPI00260A3E3E|nr:GNAT family N-acetyltransferase [uncultured Litoreibacter sp.]
MVADNWQLALLNEAADGARVLDCAQRARDYILLEAGREPDATWVTGYFNDIPPGRTKEDILVLGIEQVDGSLTGLLGMAPGYETQSEWYIGLLLVAESERGNGLGATVLKEVVALAKASGAQTLKVAVLTKNAAGLRFWERHGFEHLRDAPDDGQGDGHDRVVLQRRL